MNNTLNDSRRGRIRFAKNGISNLVSGGASAFMAIMLPYFFVRYFTKEEFALWVLVFQLAAYVNYLNFGVQTAVGRYVAHYIGLGNIRGVEDVLTGGFQILTALCLCGFALLGVIALYMPVMFPSIETELVRSGRVVLFWVGGALALGLPFSVFAGVFVGMQRNDIPALTSLVTKGVLTAALIAVAATSRNLERIAQTFFLVSVLGYVLQYCVYRYTYSNWKLRLIEKVGATRELLIYCASVTIWYVAIFIVSGISVTLVGIFDYNAVSEFGLAVSVISFFLGVIRALVSPVLQVFTKLNAKGEIESLLNLLGIASFVTMFGLLCSGLWISLFAPFLIQMWVGSSLATATVPIFLVLLWANVVRCSAIPFANYLLATGKQTNVYAGQIAEAISNLGSSLVFATFWGAIGIAWGTVLGACVLILCNFLYTLRITMPSDFLVGKYFLVCIVAPLVTAAPMICIVLYFCESGGAMLTKFVTMIIGTGISTTLAWRYYSVTWRSIEQFRLSR